MAFRALWKQAIAKLELKVVCCFSFWSWCKIGLFDKSYSSRIAQKPHAKVIKWDDNSQENFKEKRKVSGKKSENINE